MLVLTAADVERLLTPERAMTAMRSAMRQVSEGQAVLPLRQFMTVPGEAGGKLGLMPGAITEPPLFGVKIVSKFPRAAGSAHSSHVGAVLVFGADDGLPVALIEGGTLTAIRTAAASALATDLLARADATVHLVTGAGEQAARHVEAIRHVRPAARTLIWARDRSRVEDIAARCRAEPVADLERAVGHADIVSTTTSAAEPYLRGRWLRPGVHLNLVGSAIPTTAEVDDEAVSRARVFVDYRTAAEAQAGELRRAVDSGSIGPGHVIGEIGELLLGRIDGRRSPDDITLYKSLGVPAQDLAAAATLIDAARAEKAGVNLDL